MSVLPRSGRRRHALFATFLKFQMYLSPLNAQLPYLSNSDRMSKWWDHRGQTLTLLRNGICGDGYNDVP
jgi:hypothetical protein